MARSLFAITSQLTLSSCRLNGNLFLFNVQEKLVTNFLHVEAGLVEPRVSSDLVYCWTALRVVAKDGLDEVFEL